MTVASSLLCLGRWLPVLSLGFAAAGGLVAAVTGPWPATSQFSTSNGNPNGVWTYEAGATALPLTANWTGNGTLGCTVPAWAPSNTAGNFAPAFFQANACVSSFFGADPTYPSSVGLANVAAGAMVVRTSDDSSVHASLLFTMPAINPNHPVPVWGYFWNARIDSQPQDWVLFINGVQAASGVLSGTVGQGAAQEYASDLLQSFNPGDTVELDLFKDPNSSSGDFVGVNFGVSGGTFFTLDTAEIDTYNTTNVTQQVNAYQVELKARMQGGAYLYDQTFNAPLTDPTVQAAIA